MNRSDHVQTNSILKKNYSFSKISVFVLFFECYMKARLAQLLFLRLIFPRPQFLPRDLHQLFSYLEPVLLLKQRYIQALLKKQNTLILF